MVTITTLTYFNGLNGFLPDSSLIIDASGDLFGTTIAGGGDEGIYGTIFELPKTGSSYASVQIILAELNGTNGYNSNGGLIADSNGDLFGTAENGGANNDGTVFEIANMGGEYANTPIALVSFNGADGANSVAGLIMDANGDLFGTTTSGGGTSSAGTVFEIAHTASGYASTPTTLVSFDVTDGAEPRAGLIADAQGDLFGTTTRGDESNSNDGTVFEVTKTTSGYANTPITIASFNETDGINPDTTLIADAKGNLFGTTSGAVSSGTEYGCTVFEIAKTPSGYASTPTTIVSFSFTDFAGIPSGRLLMDASGDLFGTTSGGGASNEGMVFEVVKTAAGYASTPTTLVNFDDTDGAYLSDGLTADANGDLFGTTEYGGSSSGDAGTVFEITDSGYVVACFCPGTNILTPSGEVLVERLATGDKTLTAGGAEASVRWIGCRSYDGRFVSSNHLMLPVTIQASAFADGVPHTDLQVSPGHAMWVDGELVPAWRLVNGATVTQAEKVEEVTYFHVELHQHDLLLANGAPAESFLDETGFRGQFQNAGEFTALYPNAVPLVPMQARLEDGFALQHIQERLLDRAGLLPSLEPAGALRGYVDQAGPERVCGWAQDVESPEEPVALEISVGDVPVLTVLANAFRADLRKAGMGSGCHAFGAQIPIGFIGVVTVKRVTDGALLGQTDTASQRLLVA